MSNGTAPKKGKVVFSVPDDNANKNVELRKGSNLVSADIATVKKCERLRLHKKLEDAVIVLPTNQVQADKTPEDEDSKISRCFQRIGEYGDKSDFYVAIHSSPVHHLCIGIAVGLIPFFILTIIWDVMAAVVFEIPHLSTISAPTFILLINFIAVPLSMYGYMTEYLIHHNSRLAVIGLICVFIHPILFLIRAYMEYRFDGYRNELQHYYESLGSGEDE